MSRASQRDRDEFIAIMTKEGVPLDVARQLMTWGASLHRIAELECSSEAADRDRVPCPGRAREAHCICEHWKSMDGERGCGCTSSVGDPGKHHPVTRIARREQNIRFNAQLVCRKHDLVPLFGGDPRGAVLIVQLPSGKTNDWGGRGVVVP